jgi:hypothetical protein
MCRGRNDRSGVRTRALTRIEDKRKRSQGKWMWREEVLKERDIKRKDKDVAREIYGSRLRLLFLREISHKMHFWIADARNSMCNTKRASEGRRISLGWPDRCVFLMMLLIMFDHVCARAWIRVILVCRERLSSKQKNENGHFAYMKPPFWGFIQSPQLIRLHNFAAVFCSQQRFKFCQEPFSTVA